MSNLNNIRTDYVQGDLNLSDLPDSPFDFFNKWMKNATELIKKDANAFVLSTVDSAGSPSSRVVLLRQADKSGFSFFTNYNSYKAQSIDANQKVSMNFFWPELERQIRVDGTIEKVSDVDSDTYFNSRPYASQIGAWASDQSTVLSSRKVIEERVEFFKDKFPIVVPRPPHWGGYKITPISIEFWQGRASRLHDRFKYDLISGKWEINRLAP
jgi:pyridoxamine 5'-phosphate oxidase